MHDINYNKERERKLTQHILNQPPPKLHLLLVLYSV